MKFNITPFSQGQENEISLLIRTVYDEYVAPDYTEEGNRFFYNWIAPERIAERQKTQVNLLIASIEQQVVGTIEIRENKNISLLFVHKNYHGKGIAKRLFKEALKMCCSRDENLQKFYVHASPYSIPVYERLGFTAIDSMKEDHGILYLPMAMNVQCISCMHKESQKR